MKYLWKKIEPSGDIPKGRQGFACMIDNVQRFITIGGYVEVYKFFKVGW